MTDLIFGTILENGTITGTAFICASVCSLALGLFIAFTHSLKGTYTKSFLVTLALIPVIVQLVIILVNGNIGAGVAVAGAFSLVRFRSAAGTAQEITGIFLAMAVGLATGMGYLGIAVIVTLMVTLAHMILSMHWFGEQSSAERTLKIMIPENLDFEGVFDDLFEKYTKKAELSEVKTAEMGSLYKLTYQIVLRQGISVKTMLDEMRQRNGNLEIACGRPVSVHPEEL